MSSEEWDYKRACNWQSVPFPLVAQFFMWTREKRKENWWDFHVHNISITFCHVFFSDKARNVIHQTSMRGATDFGVTSFTAFLNVDKCSGCREEQSGADTLRSLVGWVGIVTTLTFGKWNENAKRAGTVIYCAPKFSGAVGECCEDLHAGLLGNKTSVAFHVSLFQVGLRPTGML